MNKEEDFEKTIDDNKHDLYLLHRKMRTVEKFLLILDKRILKLEQAQTYFPCHSDNKYIFEHFTDYCIGGVDNIKIEKIESPESNFIAYDLTKLEKGDD